MKDSSIRTKKIIGLIVGTYVKNLALSFHIGIVTRELLSIATEASLRNFVVYGIIAARFAWYSRVIAFIVGPFIIVRIFP